MTDEKQDYDDLYWKSEDGLRLYARDYAPSGSSSPNALPIICLHGLTRNSKDFAELAPRISALGHRVLVPDTRGRGLSEYASDPDSYILDVYAEDVILLLKHLKLDRAIFIGTSMGGIITHYLARKNADLIAAVVLNDIGPIAAAEGLARIGSYAGIVPELSDWDGAKAYVKRINAAAFPDYDDNDWADFARKTFCEDADGKPALDYDPLIRKPIEEGKYGVDAETAWKMFANLADAIPILLLRGEHSDILSYEIAKKMVRIARDMQMFEISNVGHAPFMTETEAFAAIADFLANIKPSIK